MYPCQWICVSYKASFLDPKVVTQPFLGVNEGIWMIVIGGRETVEKTKKQLTWNVTFLYACECIYVESASVNVIYVVLLETVFPKGWCLSWLWLWACVFMWLYVFLVCACQYVEHVPVAFWSVW